MKSIYTTGVFDAWFESLCDKQAARRIQARIDRAEEGNFGDCKPVGEGVSEMRIHYGQGYRVYFAQRGFEIVILLAGGDKATQAKDIKIALGLAKQIKE
jgi:putative addiction module killer protein